MRAITYLAEAAAGSQQRFAPREAITCLEAALKLAEHLFPKARSGASARLICTFP